MQQIELPGLALAAPQSPWAISPTSAQRFSVARGEVRELSGVRDFRVCVGTDATTLGPDCRPAQPAAPAAP